MDPASTLILIVVAVVIVAVLVLFVRSRSAQGARSAGASPFAPTAPSPAQKPAPQAAKSKDTESAKAATGEAAPVTRKAEGLFEQDEAPKPQAAVPAPSAPPALQAAILAGKPPTPLGDLLPAAPASTSAPPPPPKPSPAPGAAHARPPEPSGGAPADDTREANDRVRAITRPADPGSAPADDARSAAATEDVRFTAYFPKEAAVDTWYTLLVYAHVEAALAKVQADAAKFKDELGSALRQTQSATPAKLARGTEIAIVPTCDGITFNPERITLGWIEDVHRAEFRFSASKDLAGAAANLLITIFVGPLIVSTLKGGLLFDEPGSVPAADTAATNSANTAAVSAELYKEEQIFVSYSHDDTPVVLACRDAYRALGYTVLIDIDTLRAGEKWHEDLRRMIDRADIFQLFWSAHSAKSMFCQQEWEYALQGSRSKEGFIRPVYWEKPLVPPPDELAELHFAYIPLGKTNTP